MYVRQLGLKKFRNYHNLEIDFPKGLIVLTGGNAQGKSNLLEAVYFLSIAKAYKANSDREAIYIGSGEGIGHTQIIGNIQSHLDEFRVMLELQLDGANGHNNQERIRKSIWLNGNRITAIDFVGMFNAVMFDPEDTRLVTGAPVIRRKYLDILACQLDRKYLISLQKYQKILYQRNHLLRLIRDRQADLMQLDFWDEILISEGSFITQKRYQIVLALGELVVDLHMGLTDGHEELSVEYLSSLSLTGLEMNDITRKFERVLGDGRKRELELGSTQWGPHRDDLKLSINRMSATNYASRGQARTLALTLKLAEGVLIERERGEPPILLLDDVLSELDSSRRMRILEYVTNSEQAMLSTTDIGQIDKAYLGQAHKLNIEAGNINTL